MVAMENGVPNGSAASIPHVVMLATPGMGHLFGMDSFDAAYSAGIERRYLFIPTNLHLLTLMLHLPELDISIPGTFQDLAEPLQLPGCVPIPGKDLLSPLQDKSNPCYRWMVHHASRSIEADAILVNSFDAVEPDVATDVGFLVSSWAPQIDVLAHQATGGFLTHCGWNSTLESLVHGVPMLAWPLYAEQHQNAVMLAEGIGVAIRVPELKGKEMIAEVVKELMAGEGKGAEVRTTVANLQKDALEGLSEGGAASTALAEVVGKWAGDQN